MNSRVIKFVAGAGKTTWSIDYLKNHNNGLYLAFNNDVVYEISNRGLLSKTMDSFFQSYLIPKFTSIIPLIGYNRKVKSIDTQKLPDYLRGVPNIKISAEDGTLYNRSKKLPISLNTPYKEFVSLGNFPNSLLIGYIFSKNELRITNDLRAELSNYIINKYPDLIISLIKSRFSYIIIDEAQDLKNNIENFAKLIYNSDMEMIILGDDNQNINAGGQWFESLLPDETQNISHRCPKNNCEWIRDNLNIKIFGNENESQVQIIEWQDVLSLNDGNRVLLYPKTSTQNEEIISKWRGQVKTIKSAKGSTIKEDIVIIGKKLTIKNLYTAITRTTKNVYSTVKEWH